MSRLIFNAVLGGTTTLESTNSADTFLITVPAANGTMAIKDSSGDATFRNITLTGAVLAGAWNGSTIAVGYGGTGATTLTGYVKGNGTSAMTASATIPNTDITGLGTMSTQNAGAVTITGGTISGLGTPLPVASGGSGAATLTGYVKGNGTSAYTAASTIPNTDITGLGTMSTQGADAVAITGGTANGLTIGASNPAAAIFTTLRFNSTLSANGSTGTSGQVLTSNGASAPTWQTIAGSGTVTSVDVSGGTTGLTTSGGPITGSGTITLAGTLGVANGGTGATTLTGYVKGSGTSAMTASATIPTSDLSGTISNAQLANSAITINGTSTSLGGSISVGTVTSVGGTGTVNGLTLTGTVTSSGNLTLGGTLDLSSPPAIGGTAPAAGTFTDFSASGTASFTSTGAVKLPVGTTAQQPGTPATGMLRFNSTDSSFEGYDGSAWGAIGGGGGIISAEGLWENAATITANYTITAGNNAMSAGPITVASGVTVTVPSGSVWTVV